MTARVTAVLVTRGNVDLAPIVETLAFDELVVWNNAAPRVEDLGAFGRYAALAQVKTPLVYVQDDDTLVTADAQVALLEAHEPGTVVSNMHDWHNAGMPWLALPGWGAIFDHGLPAAAFARWAAAVPDDFGSDDFNRIGCDIVFPVLTPSRMIDLGHENLPYAHDADRTHRRRDYQAKKQRYYSLAAELRRRHEALAA